MDRIKKLLNSTGSGKAEVKDKLDGMKYLLAVGFSLDWAFDSSNVTIFCIDRHR